MAKGKNTEKVEPVVETENEVVETEEPVVETEKVAEVKKYKIFIPLSDLNPQDKKITVGVNEKYATICRGVETEVEEPVYEQLKNAGLV